MKNHSTRLALHQVIKAANDEHHLENQAPLKHAAANQEQSLLSLQFPPNRSSQLAQESLFRF